MVQRVVFVPFSGSEGSFDTFDAAPGVQAAFPEAGEDAFSAHSYLVAVPKRALTAMPEQDLSIWTPALAIEALAGVFSSAPSPAHLIPIRARKNERA